LLASVGPAPAQPAQAKAESLRQHAGALTESRQYLEAAQVCQEALREYQVAARDNPGDLRLQLAYIRCRNQLADAQTQLVLCRQAKEVLDETQALLRQLLAGHANDAALRFELARAHQLLGARAALMGRADEAAPPLQAALELFRKLAGEDPGRLEYREEVLKTLRVYADQLGELARYPEAQALLEEALRVGPRLVGDSPNTPRTAQELSLACSSYSRMVLQSGDYPWATDLMRQAIGVMAQLEKQYPDHPEYWYSLPSAWLNFAQRETYGVSAAEAEKARHEVERLRARLAGFPDAAKKWLTDEDRVINTLVSNKDFGRLASQPELAEGLVKGLRQQAEDHPEVGLLQLRLSAFHTILGEQLLSRGATEAALAAFCHSVQRAEKAALENPDVPRFGLLYAKTCQVAGAAYRRCGKADEGERLLQQAVAVSQKLARDFQRIPGLRVQAVTLQVQAAAAQPDAGGAVRYLSAALEGHKQLVHDFPHWQGYRYPAAQTAGHLAKALATQGAQAQAQAAYREAVGLLRQATADFPRVVCFRLWTVTALGNLAGFLQSKERDAEAEAVWTEVVAASQKLVQDFPDEVDYRGRLADAYCALGAFLDGRQRHAAAVQHYSAAIACTELALKSNPRRRDCLNMLRMQLELRAHSFLDLGKRAEYEADQRRVEALLDQRLKPPVLRLMRIGRNLAEGKQAQALQEADDLFLGGELAAAEWAELAGAYAQATASLQDAGDREKYAARAAEALGHALDQGYAFAGPLEQDVRFRGLAGRGDFQKLAAAHRPVKAAP
jgi:tetratricopeptide (TPR) repeat protein